MIYLAEVIAVCRPKTFFSYFKIVFSFIIFLFFLRFFFYLPEHKLDLFARPMPKGECIKRKRKKYSVRDGLFGYLAAKKKKMSQMSFSS